MNVGELKQRLNGFKDESPVLIVEQVMGEVHELRTVEHDSMVEWIEQQRKHVCVLATGPKRPTHSVEQDQ